MMLGSVSAAAFALLMIIAAAGDVLSRRISNALIVLTVGLFFPFSFAHGMAGTDILMSVAAATAVLAAGFALFSVGYLGGGDAKLLGAAGLWLGFSGLAQFLALTVLAGGMVGLVMLAWLFVRFQILLRRPELTPRLLRAGPSVPYGYAVAAGAILSLPGSWMVPSSSLQSWLTQI